MAEQESDQNGFLVGMAGAAANGGAWLYANTNNAGDDLVRLDFNNVLDNAGVSAINVMNGQSLAVPFSSPTAFAARRDGTTGKKTVDYLTGDDQSEFTPSLVTQVAGAKSILLGSASATFTGQTKIYAAALFSGRLSDTDLAKVYAQMQAYFTPRAITI
ncbi:hypothetical protein KM176_00045 [Pseudooceanicola sp. CBS1P-1]|uniref:Uncharacterized protein n=1 Tax=Pseudooceanicola albus TaxID=2692189 RepID=A0A6L7FZQ2_9RHOB|nr:MULTISPECIES: hypothetical protein [Pseudooceanicola]MBT9382237.1 hypothetical protein [Pseudooceanicola endophyticus]MXN16780.1 hypothetical protein [Pseudooceanicola albus]